MVLSSGPKRFVFTLACAVFLIVHMLTIIVAADIPFVRDNLEIENLGSPVSTRIQGASMVYRAPHSHEHHLFMQLTAYNGLGDDPQAAFLDFNLHTGETRPAMSGVSNGGGRMLLHPNGKLYIGGARPVSLVEFDTETGESRYLGNLRDNFYHGVQCFDLAPDGTIYFGHYGRHATSYNPDTGEMIDYGPMDGEGNTYLYNIASDGRYIYARMSREWYLVVYDTETGEEVVYRELSGALRRDEAGNIFFADKLMIDGDPVDPRTVELRTEDPRPELPIQMGIGDAERTLGYEFDLTGVQPTNWNEGRVLLRWRRGDDGEWREAEHIGLDIVPHVPYVMTPTPEGRIIGRGNFGPAFIFDPDTGQSEFLGQSPGHTYRILALEDTVYFLGYRSQFWVYDRNKPWTLRPMNAGYEEGDPNPVNIGGPGIRPSRMALDARGRIFAAGDHYRHREGGDLLIYNPHTGEKRSMREEMEPYSIGDLCAVNNGEVVVWSARHRADGSIHLFVNDVETGEIENRVINVSNPGYMMAVEPDIILWVFARTQEDGANETMIYRINVGTGEILSDNRIQGRAFAGPTEYDYRALDRELVAGPDGCGWLFIDNYLTRIHPDGSAEKIMEMDSAARILFLVDDLYLYGGGRQFFGGFSQILRIKNVFRR